LNCELKYNMRLTTPSQLHLLSNLSASAALCSSQAAKTVCQPSPKYFVLIQVVLLEYV
jgi:hypothetical protein